MKPMLLSLIVMLCTAPLHSAAATKASDGSHAAVTDVPSVVDMSYADPKTWYRLLPAGRIYDENEAPLSLRAELPDDSQG